MKDLHVARRLWLPLGVILGILLLSLTYYRLALNKMAFTPRTIVVSQCSNLKAGMKRIGEQYGFQFDVPVEGFRVVEGAYDAPPGGHGFYLKPKDGASFLNISWGPQMGGASREGRIGVPVDPGLISSNHANKRVIADDKGNPIGEDLWGYLDNGERWRRVRFRGWVVASYGSINEKDIAAYGSVHEREAHLFDQVIGSVCFLPPPSS